MGFIFLVLFGLFMFGKVIYDECTKTCKAFTAEEIEQMNREMIGKSQKSARKSLRNITNKERRADSHRLLIIKEIQQDPA